MRQAHGARRTSRLKRKPQHLLTLEPAPPRPDPHSTCSQEEEADKAALGMCGELWMVLQLHSAGSCCDIMASACPSGFEEPVAICILHEVLKGLGYLHQHGIIHRQLRSSNILVDSQGAVRLTDFGLSGHLVEHGERRSQRQTFVRGGIGWMAPEVLEQAQGYDSSADVWAPGITAIELLAGEAPYAGTPAG